jgi:hypothetical protein
MRVHARVNATLVRHLLAEVQLRFDKVLLHLFAFLLPDVDIGLRLLKLHQLSVDFLLLRVSEVVFFQLLVLTMPRRYTNRQSNKACPVATCRCSIF